MIAASRKKIIKMTQGERLFIVILIIFCFLTGVVKSFRYMEQAEGRQIEKIGVLLFQLFQCVPTLKIMSEHLKPR